MTDLTARRDGADTTIDLRGDGPTAHVPAPRPVESPVPEGDAGVQSDDVPWIPPDGDGEAGPGGRSRARTVLAAVLVGLLALACLEVFLVPVSYRVRQEHRRDEYRDPKARLAVGDAAFLLQIPAIGVDEVVVKGVSPALLRGGPGWRTGSAAPGQGNTVLLGHSTRWGYPFGRLGDLRSGNPIYLRTRDGRVYVYKVTKVGKDVPDGRTSVMDPTGPQRLTLVTSAGGPLDSRRVVVQAGKSGPQPEVPARLRERVRADAHPAPFDQRGPGGLLLLVGGIAVAGIGVFGLVELRKRYGTLTVLVVAGPAIALGVVLVLFNLDAFLPVTY